MRNIFSVLQSTFSVLRNIFSISQNIFSVLRNVFSFSRIILVFQERFLAFNKIFFAPTGHCTFIIKISFLFRISYLKQILQMITLGSHSPDLLLWKILAELLSCCAGGWWGEFSDGRDYDSDSDSGSGSE